MSDLEPKLLSFEALLAFAATKPPEETYNAWDADNCVLAQFVKSQPDLPEFPADSIGFGTVEVREDGVLVDYWSFPDSTAVYEAIILYPRTWGEVVRRLQGL